MPHLRDLCHIRRDHQDPLRGRAVRRQIDVVSSCFSLGRCCWPQAESHVDRQPQRIRREKSTRERERETDHIYIYIFIYFCIYLVTTPFMTHPGLSKSHWGPQQNQERVKTTCIFPGGRLNNNIVNQTLRNKENKCCLMVSAKTCIISRVFVL